MDFLFASGRLPKSETSGAHPRGWKFSEFGAIRLVAKEAGGAANQHPAALNADAVRMELARLELAMPGQQPERLFSEDELKDMVPALLKALAAAGSGDDLVLVSSARRGSGFVAALLTITARMFVQDGALQIIVKDARSDIYTPFKITGMAPNLEFGSRLASSPTVIRHPAAKSVRGDWIALTLGATASAVSQPSPAPQAPLAVQPGLAAPAAPAAVAPTPVMPAPARDQAFYEQQELRLKGLKRLFDQGLIKEDEYQQKRQEILRTL